MRSRRPRHSQAEVLAAVAQLKVDCAGIYTQIAASVARAGPLPPQVAAAVAAAAKRPAAAATAAEAGEEKKESSPEQEAVLKLRQSMEQRLVLQTALQEAAERAASILAGGRPAGAEDLEAELQRHSEDSEVQEATASLSAMHESCLVGRTGAALLPDDLALDSWEAEDALTTLSALGRARADALQRCGPKVGANVLQAVAAAEDLVWEAQRPHDAASARASFCPALARLAAKDPRFRDRCAALDRELAALAAKAARAAAPAF